MTDAAETMKSTVDSAAAATVQNQKAAIDATQDNAQRFQAAGAKAMREGVDRSVAGFGELNAQSKRNLDAVMESTTAAQRGVEALSQQALGYTKSSWEAGVAAAQSMVQAKSVQELIELQTNFAKSSMETYMAEMTKAAEVMTSSVKDSLRPINERMSASVETLQAAR